MPTPINIADLKLPRGSEYARLVERCPDIEGIVFLDGEYIVREGDRCEDVFLVFSGGFVAEHAHGETANDTAPLGIGISQMDEPSFIGEMAYFDDGVRTASVRSSGATKAFKLKPAHLDIIIEEFPLFTQVLCRRFSQRLKEANSIIKEQNRLLNLSASQRILKPDAVLFKKGDKAETLYQVIEGTLICEIDGSNETITRHGLTMGFLVPEAFLLDKAYPFTVKAQSTSFLVAIPVQAKLAVIRNYPELAMEIMIQT